MENLQAVTNVVVQSLSSLHGPFIHKWFEDKIIILTDTSLEINYTYPQNKVHVDSIKDTNSAFYLSQLRKNLS